MLGYQVSVCLTHQLVFVQNFAAWQNYNSAHAHTHTHTHTRTHTYTQTINTHWRIVKVISRLLLAMNNDPIDWRTPPGSGNRVMGRRKFLQMLSLRVIPPLLVDSDCELNRGKFDYRGPAGGRGRRLVDNEPLSGRYSFGISQLQLRRFTKGRYKI